ncbi:hypothetical protein [Streptomyces sp. NPDC001135]
MTRGTVKDYVFLGGAPEREWWRPLTHGYPAYVFQDKAGIAVSGTGDAWSAVLFGMPSARMDYKPRAIRYTLVVESEPDEASLAAGLVRLACDASARTALGAALDEVLTAEFVDALLGDDPTTEPVPIEKLTAVVRDAAYERAADIREPSIELPWVGPAPDPQAVEELAAAAHRLAEGAEGLCFVAHALKSRKDAGRLLVVLGQDLAVLLTEADFTGLHTVHPPRPGRRESADPGEDHTGPRAAKDAAALLDLVRRHPWASAGCGVLGLLLIFWTIRRM